MRELIKESIVDLKRADGFIYVTAEGKKIDLHEAAARGIAVTPVNPKDEVIKTNGGHLSRFQRCVTL